MTNDIYISRIYFIDTKYPDLADVSFHFIDTDVTRIGGEFRIPIPEHWTMNDIKKECMELFKAKLEIKDPE